MNQENQNQNKYQQGQKRDPQRAVDPDASQGNHTGSKGNKGSPSYESERKNQDQQSSADKDSSGTRRSGTSSEIDEGENEETNLNESQMQEGPKRGKTDEQKRSA